MLQTFATQQYFAKKGYDAEIIDYYPIGLHVKTGVRTIVRSGNIIKDIIRRIGASAVFISQQLLVNRFIRKNIKKTSKT
jgi:hypothetical protein